MTANHRRSHQRDLARRLLDEPVFNTVPHDDEYSRGWNAAVVAMRLELVRIASAGRET